MILCKDSGLLLLSSRLFLVCKRPRPSPQCPGTWEVAHLDTGTVPEQEPSSRTTLPGRLSVPTLVTRPPLRTQRSRLGVDPLVVLCGPGALLGGTFGSAGSVWSCTQWSRVTLALPTGRRESRPSDRTPTLPAGDAERGGLASSQKPRSHRRLIIFYRSVTLSLRELTPEWHRRPAKRGQNRGGTSMRSGGQSEPGAAPAPPPARGDG